MLSLYTDGACKGNPGLGGWAFLAVNSSNEIVQTLNGALNDTTNNQMELFAVIEALKYLTDVPQSAIIYSDSAYFVNCMNNGWYKKWRQNGWLTANKTPVQNKGLWEVLLHTYESLVSKGFVIQFCKVKGHANNEFNNLADSLANMAVKMAQ